MTTDLARPMRLPTLIALIMVAAAAGAQTTRTPASACSSSVAFRKELLAPDRRIVTVNISGIAARDSVVAIVGVPTTFMSMDDIKLDSLIGVTWSPATGVVGLPMPLGFKAIHPLIASNGNGWDIVFFTGSANQAEVLTDTKVWYGHYERGWQSIQKIAEFPGAQVEPYYTNDLVSRNGTLGLLVRVVPAPEAKLAPYPALLRRSPSGRWSTDTSTALIDGVADVLITNGASADQPLLLGLFGPRVLVGRYDTPSLSLQYGMSGEPVLLRQPDMRLPRIGSNGRQVTVTWTKRMDRNSLYMVSAERNALASATPYQLSADIKDGARVIATEGGAIIHGLDASAQRTVSLWWVDAAGQPTPLQPLTYSKYVFLYAAAKSTNDLLFVIAANVPTPSRIGGSSSGIPSMEVAGVNLRCGR